MGLDLEKLTKIGDNLQHQFARLNILWPGAGRIVDTHHYAILQLAFELSTVFEDELRRWRPATTYVTLTKNGNQACPPLAVYANPTFLIYQTWRRWLFLSRKDQSPLLTYQLLELPSTNTIPVVVQYRLLAAKFAAEAVQARKTPLGLLITEIKEDKEFTSPSFSSSL